MDIIKFKLGDMDEVYDENEEFYISVRRISSCYHEVSHIFSFFASEVEDYIYKVFIQCCSECKGMAQN